MLAKSKKLMYISVTLLSSRSGSVLLKSGSGGTQSAKHYRREFVSRHSQGFGRYEIGYVKNDDKSMHYTNISYTGFYDKKYREPATIETKPSIQYHHVSLLNQDVLRNIPFVPVKPSDKLIDGVKSLAHSPMEMVIDQYLQAVRNGERDYYDMFNRRHG
ncbi:hypothetical protein FOL47_010201 [Perkinsus chesapeaki]|uniref:Uncharacterized protein n=1 Tax=Perkinsus chesapeaki TaxID=330153 RepID=A0A7J6MR39_PERCH|nr:hypothetical protein FOL47_010201 [Perkinsus chesapeaki]